MASLTKVALVGATGNLGPAILKELVDAGLEVTVLTRKSSSHTFPAGVKVAPVDYDSRESLIDAFKDQDAVVSTLGSAALKTQIDLVDAAASAGVKRFIPSEFGSNTLNAKTAKLPAFGEKIAVQEELKKLAATGAISYTLIITGPFFDWGLKAGFIQSPSKKTATLLDGGNRPFSVTTLSGIGKAVVGVLRHPQETENRAVYVQEAAFTARELLAKGQKATGGSEGWNVKESTVQATLDEAWAELKKDKPNPLVWAFNMIFAAVWGEGYGSHFEKLDNDLLGVRQLTDDEIQAIVEDAAEQS